MAGRRSGAGVGLFLVVAAIGGALGLGRSSDPPKPTTLVAVQSPTSPTPASSVAESRVPVAQSEPAVRSPAANPPALPAVLKLTVSGHDVPMRSEPQSKAKILDRLRQGLEVEEVARSDGWVKVRHPVTSAEGWVKEARVRPKEAENPEPTVSEKPEAKPTPVPVIATATIVASLIAESRASYPGNCACPDNTDKRGHRCGGRSAYSRPGGYAPLCYPSDVTPEMIAEYRRTHTASSQ